jgi:hypothetical protein
MDGSQSGEKPDRRDVGLALAERTRSRWTDQELRPVVSPAQYRELLRKRAATGEARRRMDARLAKALAEIEQRGGISGPWWWAQFCEDVAVARVCAEAMEQLLEMVDGAVLAVRRRRRRVRMRAARRAVVIMPRQPRRTCARARQHRAVRSGSRPSRSDDGPGEPGERPAQRAACPRGGAR